MLDTPPPPAAPAAPPTSAPRATARRMRIVVTCTVALLAAAWATYVALHVTPTGDARSDFDHLWFAARTLAAGRDPYPAIGPQPGAAFRYQWPMLYPLSTVVGVVPLAALPLVAARALFVGAGAALLAWRLSADEPWRLLGFLTGGVLDAAAAGQWALLTAGAGLTPAWGALLALKPQAALAWVLATLSGRLLRDVAIAGIVLGGIALAIVPGWIPEWLAAVSTASHVRPLIVRPLAWLLLLATLRWRRLEARLLLALALVPMTPAPYELVPLVLAPRDRRQMLALVVCLLVTGALQPPIVLRVAAGAPRIALAQDVLIVGAFLPALAMVLSKPNEGPVPAWLERAARRWRRPRPSLAAGS